MEAVSIALPPPPLPHQHHHTRGGGGVRTMAVQEGHVLNIDGAATAADNNSSSTGANPKYGGVGGGVNANANADATEPLFPAGDPAGDAADAPDKKVRRDSDRVSVLSGFSGRSRASSRTANSSGKRDLPWYKGLEWKDFRGILPCFLILLVGAVVMIRITPMAYQQVYEQMKAEQEVQEMHRLAEERAAAEAAEAARAANESIVDQVLRASKEAAEVRDN